MNFIMMCVFMGFVFLCAGFALIVEDETSKTIFTFLQVLFLVIQVLFAYRSIREVYNEK